MPNKCSYKYLVIDNQDLLEINNLKRKVNQAEKHPEPVFKLDAPWDTENHQFNYLNVLYDEDEKSFRMWYNVTMQVKDCFRWADATTYPDYLIGQFDGEDNGDHESIEFFGPASFDTVVK